MVIPKSPRFVARIAGLFAILACGTGWLCDALVAEESPAKPKYRRYDQGPLKIDEFRRGPTGSVPGRALTMTRVFYNFEFETKQLARDEFEARLTSLEAFSVFLPDESWWNHPDSDRLLAHEQGHFDIAELAARRVQLTFKKLLKNNKAITALSRTPQAAAQALDEKLAKVIQVANDQAVEDNKLYDLQTRHGARVARQEEYGRILLLSLKRLNKDLSDRQPRASKEPASPKTENQPGRS